MERGQWQQGQAERSERRLDTRSGGGAPVSRDNYRGDSAPSRDGGSSYPSRGGSAPARGGDSSYPSRGGSAPSRDGGSSYPSRSDGAPARGGSSYPSRGGNAAPSRGGYGDNRPTRAQEQSRNDSAASLRAARGEEAPAERPVRPARSFDGPARSSDRPAERPGRSFNTSAPRPDREARPFDGSSARPARNADSGSARSAERPGRSFQQAPERQSRPLGTPGRPSSNHQDRPAARMGGTGASRTEIEQREFDPRREARRTAARVELPEDVEARMLDPEVRQELRSLSKDTADLVARHLVMTGRLLDSEPELALAHARAARAMAARVGPVREAAGLAAYTTGDWTDALSELRAARRITGLPGHLAVMADCERALGRPERALSLGEDRDVARLTQEERVELVIVVSGARRDMGQCDAAVLVLQDPAQRTTAKRPFAARLWYAYADALLDAGRQDDAREWFAKVVEVDQTGQTDAHERMLEIDGVEFEDLEDDGDDEVHGWIEPDTATATAGLQAAFARLEVELQAVKPVAAEVETQEQDEYEDTGAAIDDELAAIQLGGDQPPWQAPVELADAAQVDAAQVDEPVHIERRDSAVPAVTFQQDEELAPATATDDSDDDSDNDSDNAEDVTAEDANDMRLFE